jgi:glucosyl-3-phosphoglycerate synthase
MSGGPEDVTVPYEPEDAQAHGPEDVIVRLEAETCVERKARTGQRVSVCLPARNEEATVGIVVDMIVRELVVDVPLVDEVIVLDDGSTDHTRLVAEAAGATVVDASSVLPEFGPTRGKGDVLWRSLAVSSGEIVVWCDADLVGTTPWFVVGLVGPLLHDAGTAFVKGTYARPEGSGGGGRVTELLARPLLRLLRPDLAHIRQPLGGEYAGRRSVLEQQRFEADYGVEMGLLVDIADRYGIDAVTQVDLGVREHRHRPLHELSDQATSVASALLRRCWPFPLESGLDGLTGAGSAPTPVVRPPIADVRRSVAVPLPPA